MTGRELHWMISGRDVSVRIDETRDHGTFHAAGKSIPFRILDRGNRQFSIEIDGVRRVFYVLRNRNQFSVWHNGRTHHFSRIDKAASIESGAAAASGDVTALMPGKILRVEVAEGDEVREKQVVVLMESMKMETPLHAPRAGRVVTVRCKAGQVVEMGDVLLVVEST
jgi:biotin carboxyl carrier protein